MEGVWALGRCWMGGLGGRGWVWVADERGFGWDEMTWLLWGWMDGWGAVCTVNVYIWAGV